LGGGTSFRKVDVPEGAFPPCNGGGERGRTYAVRAKKATNGKPEEISKSGCGAQVGIDTEPTVR